MPDTTGADNLAAESLPLGAVQVGNHRRDDLAFGILGLARRAVVGLVVGHDRGRLEVPAVHLPRRLAMGDEKRPSCG